MLNSIRERKKRGEKEEKRVVTMKEILCCYVKVKRIANAQVWAVYSIFLFRKLLVLFPLYDNRMG